MDIATYSPEDLGTLLSDAASKETIVIEDVYHGTQNACDKLAAEIITLIEEPTKNVDTFRRIIKEGILTHPGSMAKFAIRYIDIYMGKYELNEEVTAQFEHLKDLLSEGIAKLEA